MKVSKHFIIGSKDPSLKLSSSSSSSCSDDVMVSKSCSDDVIGSKPSIQKPIETVQEAH